MSDYDHLARYLDGKVQFETLASRPEPGINLDAPIREGPVTLGERFAGQTLVTVVSRDGAQFDDLSGSPPTLPLRVLPGPTNRNLSLAFHPGLGSMAVFPLGPKGFPDISARGEGALAVLFDNDQPATGFRFHAAYAAPLGQNNTRRGTMTVRLFARDGRVLATHRLRTPYGPGAVAFQTRPTRAAIAGLLITNTDPGGIAIDDILYQRLVPLS